MGALVDHAVSRLAVRALSVLAFLVMVVALLLLAKTTQNTEEFGRLHYVIVLLNAAGVLLLLGLILVNILRLGRDYIKGIPGARLKGRMIGMFAALAAVPLILVYLFSMYFLNRGIQSYFDADVTRGLDDALTLSQTVLDMRMREHMERLDLIARQAGPLTADELAQAVGGMRQELQAAQLTFIASNNAVQAVSREPSVAPQRMSDELLAQVRSGLPMLDIEPAADGGLNIRAAQRLQVGNGDSDARVVFASFPVSSNIAELAESVQETYSYHNNLEFIREPLIDSFKLTLSLVLLVSLLLTLWGIFFIARRIVKPIQDLVAGTRAVAAGDFAMQLPEGNRDDIGFLVASFNNMTRRLSHASEVEQRSREAVEAERANLQKILGNLSSGVMVVGPDRRVLNVNDAASSILETNATAFEGQLLAALTVADETSSDMSTQLALTSNNHLEQGHTQWRQQLSVHGPAEQRILSTACTPLPNDENDQPMGYVIVFEDVTTVLQAQREAAWSEVARRLAHEIKNPLTPIQLSAERMRRKYLGEMTAHEADVLERATRTIVQQVETMRDMVDAFRDYARAPEIELARFDLNRLMGEVVDLYRGGDPAVALRLDLDETLTSIVADSGRLRQILHNLLRNAIDAVHEQQGSVITLSTRAATYKAQSVAEIVIEDNGPGFPEAMMRTVFEPYVTSKPKGTGLGLAIVKKLVEEHAGVITISNVDDGGARVRILLPVDNDSRAALIPDSPEQPRRESA